MKLLHLFWNQIAEDAEYIPDIVGREMDDDADDEVDENEENDLLMPDEASDDDGENNEDKCEMQPHQG